MTYVRANHLDKNFEGRLIHYDYIADKFNGFASFLAFGATHRPTERRTVASFTSRGARHGDERKGELLTVGPLRYSSLFWLDLVQFQHGYHLQEEKSNTRKSAF